MFYAQNWKMTLNKLSTRLTFKSDLLTIVFVCVLQSIILEDFEF